MSTVTAMPAPESGLLTIKIEGRFEAADREAFETVYTSAAPGTRFVLDLSETDELATDSLGALLGLRHHAGGESGRVDIINSHGKTRTLLELMNFDQLFNIS